MMADYRYVSSASNKHLQDNRHSSISNSKDPPNQTQMTSTIGNSSEWHSTLSYDHSKSVQIPLRSQVYSNSNNMTASNPFETNVAAKTPVFTTNQPTFQAPTSNRQTFNHFQVLPPSYPTHANANQNSMHHVQFQHHGSNAPSSQATHTQLNSFNDATRYNSSNPSQQNVANNTPFMHNEVPLHLPQNNAKSNNCYKQAPFVNDTSFPAFNMSSEQSHFTTNTRPSIPPNHNEPTFPYMPCMPQNSDTQYMASSYRNAPPSAIMPSRTNVHHEQFNPAMQQSISNNQMPSHSYSPMPAQTYMPFPSPATMMPYVEHNVQGPVVDPLEDILSDFLKKFSFQPDVKEVEEEQNASLSVVHFRSYLMIGNSLLQLLSECKDNLTQDLPELDESAWNSDMERAMSLKNNLSKILHVLTNPEVLKSVQDRLKKIKRTRSQKKSRRKKYLIRKQNLIHARKELDQKIDRWLDTIKEQNMKLKRETEMKKEADYILSEVRRKIHETKKSLEKLKAFQKLRQARKENAANKSLFVLPSQDVHFVQKITLLRETMLKQLSDYEAEERALKVMLETEQEGQLEEEAKWRVKRLKHLQQRKQRDIQECLFGTTDEPEPSDPLYLFYQHQNIGNSSIENLVQIRHQWDSFLAPPDGQDASSVSHQWVVPLPPQNPSWECIEKG